MNKQIIYKNVLTLRYTTILFIILLSLIPLVVVLMLLANYFLLSKIVAFFFWFVLIYCVLRYFKKDITIKFDNDNIYFDISGKVTKYKKVDVLGFYSFDYPTDSTNSKISICFYFRNGRKLEISELTPDSKYNLEKSTLLIEYFKHTIKELNFKQIKRSRFRKLFMFGYIWYSRG